MKLLYLFIFLLPLISYSQTDPETILMIKEMEAKDKKEGKLPDKNGYIDYKDTIKTKSGFKIYPGLKLKIGVGSMPDGDFKFIRVNLNSLFRYTGPNQTGANQYNSFPRDQSGLLYEVKKIMRRGNDNHGFVYYAKIGGIKNFEIDLENAINSGELDVPDEFKPKSKPILIESKAQISVAEELTKLKKLLDDGVLTKDEFDQQKKKILGNN